MKSKLFLIFFFSTILLSACKGDKDDNKGQHGGKPKGLKVEGYIVTPTEFQNKFSASGSLLPSEEIEIHSEISGRITVLNFIEGSHVKKGQTLVHIYDADIKAQIQKLKAQKELQQKIINRQHELLKIGGISQQDFETTETQISSINADIAIQEAALRKTVIVAPFDGVISIRNVSNGAIVSPTTLIATLQQISSLKMDFTVPEQYSNSLRNNQEVFFSITGDTNIYTGKIMAIDPSANMATRSVNVRAVVPNTKEKLLAGAFAEVNIPLAADMNALLIPTQAVIPTTREKKVAVVKDGRATLQTVALGDRGNEKVQIIKGLSAGDTIVLTGLMQLKPGMDVTITKIQH